MENGMAEASTVTASWFQGCAVYDSQGKTVGTIQDLVIDLRSGAVAYAVVALGDTLQWRGMLIAIPWPALIFRNGRQDIFYVAEHFHPKDVCADELHTKG
jgi:sporulation protein YlmC with PRC-barrel domain